MTHDPDAVRDVVDVAGDVPPAISNRTHIGGMMLAGVYIATIVAIAMTARPLEQHVWAMATIVLLPSAVMIAAGIPRVMLQGSRRTMVLFHLVLYPLAAALTFGLPSLFVAFQVAEQFG